MPNKTTSMYEQILQLPIFQGISGQDLTRILEKTPFHFQRFRPGETIYECGDTSSRVVFVLSGAVRLITGTFGNRVSISQDFEAPHTMPFYYMFGAETKERSSLHALEPAGVMMLDKANFLNVLQQNQILLMNVLNILCTHAQKQHKAMDFSGENDAVLRLSSWMLAFTDRVAQNIYIEAKVTDWCNMLQLDQAAYWRCVAQLEGQKCVEVMNGKLKLLDRYGLRTFVSRKIAQK